MTSPRFRTPALIAGALAPVLALSLAGSAQAATRTQYDKKHDVITRASRESVPDEKTADIRWIKVQHSTSAVKTTVRIANLDVNDWQLETRITTPKRTYTLRVFGEGSNSRAELFSAGKPVDCRALTSSSNHGTNQIGSVVPRSCIGTPKWVRVGAIMTSPTINDGVVVDDARLDGKVGSSPKLGGKINVG